ncbi:type II secretion system F family protein [Actinokineospora globicatena]|uniref:type II secretion system F family protein n=2 Tax=Actinokineospora globicatena TaxID=103729 RepID=UPI002552F9B2|nr:type II secretion system protein [Actinokineospora globicatena]
MVLVLLALAALAWPSSRAGRRLRRLAGVPARHRLRRPKSDGLLVMLGVVGGWMLLGIGGAVAAALVGVALCYRRRLRARQKGQLAELEELSEAVAGLVAELATGAHPVTAAEQAAREAPSAAAETLRLIATASRLGGESDVGPFQLRQAWHLTARHGVPLVTTLSAVAQDLAHRARFSRAVQARLAGPQVSAALLSGLPAVGLALGQATGARPFDALATTLLGQAALTLGALLTAVGLIWTTRITTRAVPTQARSA